MRMRPLFSVFVAGMLVLSMALVACGDDDDDNGLNGNGDETPLNGETPTNGETPANGDETPGNGDETPTGTEEPDGNGDGETVTISSDAPGDSVSISAGDAVTFVNETGESTTVTIIDSDGNIINQEEVDDGEEFEYTFDNSGDYVVTTDALPDYETNISVS